MGPKANLRGILMNLMSLQNCSSGIVSSNHEVISNVCASISILQPSQMAAGCLPPCRYACGDHHSCLQSQARFRAWTDFDRNKAKGWWWDPREPNGPTPDYNIAQTRICKQLTTLRNNHKCPRCSLFQWYDFVPHRWNWQCICTPPDLKKLLGRENNKAQARSQMQVCVCTVTVTCCTRLCTIWLMWDCKFGRTPSKTGSYLDFGQRWEDWKTLSF